MCRLTIHVLAGIAAAAVCSHPTATVAAAAAAAASTAAAQHAEMPQPAAVTLLEASLIGRSGIDDSETAAKYIRLLRREAHARHEAATAAANANNKERKDEEDEEQTDDDAEDETKKKGNDNKKDKQHKHHKEVLTPTEAEWEVYQDDLFICRHFKNICSPGLLKRLRYAVVAGAKMHHDVWYMGGEWLSFLGFLCLLAGIYISRKVDGDDGSPGAATKCAPEDEYCSVGDDDGTAGTVGTALDDDEDEDDSESDDGFDQHELGSNVADKKFTDRMADWWTRNLSRNRPKSRQRYSTVSSSDEEEQHENAMTFLPPIKEEEAPATNSPSKSRRRRGKRTASRVCHGAKENVLTYWTDTTLTFTEPLLTFKVFLAALLFVELNDIMAPEQSMLATPEFVGILRELPKHKEFVPHYADWLMPGLNDGNADEWIALLQAVRATLLCSWFAFLLLPKRHALVGGALYGLGAVLYVYLGVIGLMYDLAHSTQGGMLFILAAVPAVPFLESNRRANHWLRKFLYIGVLVPIYLFSGICKIRYEGVVANVTGFWLWQDFVPKIAARSVIPNVFHYIQENHWATCFMSWGNIVTELVLPLLVMFFNESGPVRLVFHLSEILFHFTIFLLMGPNFTRYCLMHILASDPLSYVPYFARRRRPNTDAPPGRATRGDWARVVLAIFIMLAWFRIQVRSDLLHLTGRADSHQRPNPYFPIPELSMFAQPSDTPNFGVALGMVAASFLALAIDMVR